MKTNVTATELAHHTENTNMIYGSSSKVLAVNRQASQRIMIRPYLSTSYTAENHITWNIAEDDRVNHGRVISREWTSQSLSSPLRLAYDRNRRVTMTADASVGGYRKDTRLLVNFASTESQ